MPAKKYYAFANGARVGIYYEFWKDVQHLNKVSKPIYKGFNNFEDAQKFMAGNGVIVDELSSATELGLHKKRANSDEDQRSTTNQVQDIPKRVNQTKRNCEVLSAKENLGPKMIIPIHHMIMEVKKITGLPFKKRQIAMKARKE